MELAPPPNGEAERERLGFVDKLESGTRRVLLENFSLPMPPSANNYWRASVMFSKDQDRHIAYVHTTDDAKAYVERVGEIITSERKRHWSGNPLRIQIVCCFKNNGRADIDNRVKPLLDALKEAQLFKDDKQVEEIEVRRGPPLKTGRVVVSCWEILPDRPGALTWVKRRA